MPILVAHTCNPRYSGDRDQDDCGLQSTHENLSQKYSTQKWVSGVILGTESLHSKY
jgi:hypothetical protein